jgi:hypothetical protein
MSSEGAQPKQRIVAVGLLTEHDLSALGPSFRLAWPIDETPCFDGLLQATDEADRVMRLNRDEAD